VDQEFAKDLVCGMQVRISDAPAEYELNGKTYYFCMPGCRNNFAENPNKFISADR
jgi:YHS domain-containing protein